MQATPGQIRIRAEVSARAVSRATGVDRECISRYETHPDLVKTDSIRMVLDRYYARLARLVEETEADRAALRDAA